jgi:trichothecene 3-O-acetyltransferase
MVNGNLDRRNLVPLFDDSWQPGPKPSQTVKPVPSPSTPADHSRDADPVSLTWAYFVFKLASLITLKAYASSSLPASSTSISTDDALNSLVWQSVVRGRISHLEPSTDSIFTRAVDLRPYMDLPVSFPGNMVDKVTYTSTLQELENSPVGVISSQFRSALDPDKLRYETRAQAIIQSRKTVAPVAERDRTKYVMMSWWSKVDCHLIDFALSLGPPDAVRRPQFVSVKDGVYLRPKALDGEIVAGLYLRDDDMGKLKADEEFVRCVEYIG